MRNFSFCGRVLLAVVAIMPARTLAAAPERRVAVTFDDLPAVSAPVRDCDTESLERFTTSFVRMLKEQRLPVTGFANLGSFCADKDAVRRSLLDRWASAGFDVANHGYSHLDLSQTDSSTFVADVRKDERILREVQERAGRKLIWFRFPFLRTGDTHRKKREVAAALSSLGYRIAPVTFDNDEWVFASAYSRARDEGARERIGRAYLSYMEEIFAYYERYSRNLFGYEPPQVLLLHANELNLRYFPALADLLRGRAYQFVSLEEAVSHPAYRSADNYVGRRGLSWLLRWGQSLGVAVPPSPEPPQWVSQITARSASTASRNDALL